MPHQTILKRKIMWGDLDPMGIVFYPRYYQWFDAAAHNFFDSIGLNLFLLMRKRNTQFGLVETGSSYKSPGRYFDEILISSRIETITKKTVILSHRILRTTDKITLVEGFEKRICIRVSEQGTLKAADIPEDIYHILWTHK